MRRLLAAVTWLVAVQAAAAGPAVAPQKNWLELTTPNFRVIGGAGEGALRRVAGRLEQFREALGILFPNAVLVSSVPTTVIVFRGPKEYEPFTPLYNGKPKELTGYFLAGRTVNYVTLAAGGADDFGIIYHEYVHLVMNNTMRDVPLWYNEGLAEYYATFEVTPGGREALLGRLQAQHVLRLREQWLPLPALLSVGHDSPYYNERDKMSVFYAESWALVHYLVLGHERKYAKSIGTFVAELADGKALDEACTRAFGITPATLERELRSYVQGDRFFHQSAPLYDPDWRARQGPGRSARARRRTRGARRPALPHAAARGGACADRRGARARAVPAGGTRGARPAAARRRRHRGGHGAPPAGGHRRRRAVVRPFRLRVAARGCPVCRRGDP